MRSIAALACALLFAASAAHAAPETRPTSADLVRLRMPSDLAISPDGARVAYVVATASFDSAAKPSEDDPNAGWSRSRQVWVVDAASKLARQLTQGEAGAAAPCWSPDGRSLAFTRKGGLWWMPVDGGEPQRIATGALSPEAPRFSPDGTRIAFLAEETLPDAEKQARWARGGAIHWEHEFALTQLWVVPVAGGEPRAMSGGKNVVSFTWAPDGRRLAMVTSPSADPYVVSNITDAAIVDAGKGTIVRALDRPSSTYGTPAWSPDGKWLALTALNDGLSNVNAILLWDPATGAVRDLAPDKDRSFGGIAWGADSKSVLAVVRERTGTTLTRFPITGEPATLPFAGRVIVTEPVTDAASNRLAFVSATDRSPEDVTTFDPAAGRTAVLTGLNPEVAAWPLGETRVVGWKNADGQAIEGVLTLASGARPGSPAPLVVIPHGGPDDVTTVRFSALTQYFASRGYSVLRPNYRGSFGYGFAFYEANRNRFGEVEQADIESGVDQLVRDGLADAKKLYFGGWSWGGYITTWTITHVSRYRAAVAGAAVSDVSAYYSLSDINHGLAAQWEYKGDPWNQPAHFDRANPIRYVTNVKTPLLVLHGQADNRVPFVESIQLYRALADLGREVEFWAYPREDHGFVEPAHRVDYVKRWADWYDAH